MDAKILLLVFCLVIGKSAGNQLRCYACSFSATDSDKSCLDVDETTNTVDCPFTYCTIFRQEYRDPSGVVASFTRGCELSPDYLNHEIVDPSFRTYYRACTNDLCNIGNGIESITGGNLSPSPEYNGLNLLVPGKNSGAAAAGQMAISIIMLCVSVSALISM